MSLTSRSTYNDLTIHEKRTQLVNLLWFLKGIEVGGVDTVPPFFRELLEDLDHQFLNGLGRKEEPLLEALNKMSLIDGLNKAFPNSHL